MLFLHSSKVKRYSGSALRQNASFALGLQKDREAVQNSLIYTFSNGFVEGDNNRLKMIKRTMYGRASMNLLSAKVILQ